MRFAAGKVLLLLLAVAVVLNLLARTSADPWLALASAALLVLPVVSVLLRPRLGGLEVEQRLAKRVPAGSDVDAVIRVRNAGRRPTPPVRWRHVHPAFSTAEVDLPALDPGELVERVVTRTALARGVFTKPVRHELSTVTSSAPFGVIRWTALPVVGGRAVVHPVTGRNAAIELGLSDASAVRSLPVAGTGTEVLGLRHWRQGDALRDISSRATARHGRPVVLQRERDAGPALVILAEGGGHGEGWEQAVSAAASLALAALEAGRPPLLVADPPPTRLDASGLLDFFAGVDVCGRLSHQDVSTAARRVGRGGTLVLLTPGADPDRVSHLRGEARAAGCRAELLHG